MNAAWQVCAVAVGGAGGATLRYALNELFVRRGWYGLPAATFVANVLGCFLAGLALVWLERRGAATPFWRNLLMVGFLGGLTTFSALGLELWQLLRAERILLAAGTISAHVLFAVLAVALGFAAGRAAWG